MRVCSFCKKEKTFQDFYFKNSKTADDRNCIYFNNICKKCCIKKSKENYKNLTSEQKFNYSRQKNISRKIIRNKESAKKLGIGYKNYKLYLKLKKQISIKRKSLKAIKVRLNKFNPKLIKKDSNWYKERYKISNHQWLELTQDNPSHRTLIYRVKYRYDTDFNIKEKLRNQLIKKKKKYPNLDYSLRLAVSENQNTKYLDILGYKKEELKNHLEKQFTKDMTWKAFRNGKIHIDHIKPQSLFNLKDINDIKECWSLNNLQPLWAKDNIAKSNKYKEK